MRPDALNSALLHIFEKSRNRGAFLYNMANDALAGDSKKTCMNDTPCT